MITLCTIPREFREPYAGIQQNALRSWMLLRSQVEIMLFGDDDGVAKACEEFRVTHVPLVARNQFGTPLVSDVLWQAEQRARTQLLCYVNADIILTSRFDDLIFLLAARFESKFAAIAAPWNVDERCAVDFAEQDWEARLWSRARDVARGPTPWGADVFIFPRGFYAGIPPFAIGRRAWDNWLLFKASKSRRGAIDATNYIRAIHQDHPATIHAVARGSAKRVETLSPSHVQETEANRDMAGWWKASFCRADIPLEMRDDSSIRRKSIKERLKPRLAAITVYPPVLKALTRSRSFRHRLGLHRKPAAHGSQSSGS